MRVRSLKNHPYAGKIRPKGSTYEITSDKDAKILLLVKAVEVVVSFESETIENTTQYEPVVEKIAAPEPEIEAEKPEKHERKAKRGYRRKDMVAE